tara:strand:+ start:898 stop:1404 length:507 start_codon:yes stop_codon:yes gene_type:complete
MISSELISAYSELIESIMWPIVAVFVVYSLKNNISSFKYKDVEFKCHEAVNKIKAETPLPKDIKEKSKKYEYAAIDSKWAVFDAWIKLSDTIEKKLGITSKSLRVSPCSALLGADILPKDKAHRLIKLREIRNEIAHGQEVDINTSDAISYIIFAGQLIEYIQSLEIK